MMKMSRRVTACCVTLLLTLTYVTAVQRLNSINDLKKINFGKSVPKHSLLLLHWFANTVSIDNNDVIWLTFEPNNRDYGSHHYGNFERLLDPLPQGCRYYTVGNLNQGSSVELPSYVTDYEMEDMGTNMARIIIRVRVESMGRQSIDRVYITQHYENSQHQGSMYDPDHTYQVTANLLRQICEFSVEQNQRNSLSELRDNFGRNADDKDLRDIRNTWGEFAAIGLLLFIVIQEKNSNTPNRPQRAARRNTRPDYVVDIPENRQNDGDVNASDTCKYVVSIILLFLIFIFVYLFYR